MLRARIIVCIAFSTACSSSANLGNRPDAGNAADSGADAFLDASDPACAPECTERRRRLAMGESHQCAVQYDGELFCWGTNASGELGLPVVERVLYPTRVPLEGRVAEVEAADRRTCIRFDGDDRGLGYCFGAGDDGALGNGSYAPALLPAIVSDVDGVDLEEIVEFSLGANHTCVRLASGEVLCTGAIRVSSSDSTVMSPNFRLAGLSGASALSSGDAHACAVVAGGSIACWGDNSHNRLGSAEPTPTTVSGVLGARRIASGAGHTCALTNAGDVICWGLNDALQTGSGNASLEEARSLFLQQPATQLALGAKHSCALLEDATVWCWGSITSHQPCGPTVSPELCGWTAVLDLPIQGRIAEIAAGGDSTCAMAQLTSETLVAEVYCWGGSWGPRPQAISFTE